MRSENLKPLVDNIRLDVFLFDYFEDFSRSKIQKYIQDGSICVNSKIVKSSYKLKNTDVININIKTEEEIELIPYDFKLDIKYEDDYLIVLNKPKEMLTHPTSFECDKTLVNALLAHCGENLSDVGGKYRRGIVHRLDKNTTGLIIVAKTNEAHINLSQQIKEKTAIRKYLALCHGVIEEDFGVINKPIARFLSDTVKMQIAKPDDKNAKEAYTKFRVVERFNSATLVELELKTGRTHQIRVHTASISHPVIGDELYAKGFVNKTLKNTKFTGQILQSYYLSFTHPILDEIMEFELNMSELNSEMTKALNILNGENL